MPVLIQVDKFDKDKSHQYLITKTLTVTFIRKVKLILRYGPLNNNLEVLPILFKFLKNIWMAQGTQAHRVLVFKLSFLPFSVWALFQSYPSPYFLFAYFMLDFIWEELSFFKELLSSSLSSIFIFFSSTSPSRPLPSTTAFYLFLSYLHIPLPQYLTNFPVRFSLEKKNFRCQQCNEYAV